MSGLLVVTGSLHFLAPKPYARIVPAQLPSPELLVAVSGLAELVCAVGLAVPRTRRWAAWATAALFVAVFPANVAMALDADGQSGAYRWATYIRLPLQVPLIGWAVVIARSSRGPET